MLLSAAWIVLLFECLVSIIVGYVLWRFWSQATIGSGVRTSAILIYSIGCVCILALTLMLPL